MKKIDKFPSRDALTAQLVEKVSTHLRQDLQETGRASIAVSGGRTPIDFFKALSQIELDWKNVVITLVDERWVAPLDDASNERLVRENLLQNNAAVAVFIGHKTNHESPFEAVEELDAELKKLPDIFSTVILGMGEDGHTASFFPGAETLSQCIDTQSNLNCFATTPLNAPHDRMTLTLPRVLKSRWVVLHLTGDSKLAVFDQACAGSDTNEMPVRTVIHQSQAPLSVYFAS